VFTEQHFDSVAHVGSARSVLVVAHPGHELRVHGWLEIARPIVCVITDGSGRTKHSRIDSTTVVLEAAGCAIGPIYGVMTDQDLYAAMLDFDHAPFIRIVDRLAAMMLAEEIEYVAGDAEEGYNPAHDVCRLMVNAAVAIANRAREEPVKNFDFTLIGPAANCVGVERSRTIYLQLEKEALARKLAAARNYPELKAEVEAALDGAGSVGSQQHPDLAHRVGLSFAAVSPGEFAVECLRPVESDFALPARSAADTSFYELYGEKQVSAGHYTRVLRFCEHMLPLAAAIKSHVEKNT
jgi:hypothetical protein